MGCVAPRSKGTSTPEVPPVKSVFHQEYLLARKLGRGAFAQVHLCSKACDGISTSFAVKITDLRQRGENKLEAIDRKARRIVEKEAMVLRKVRHQPYCVQFREAFQEGWLSYIVMEKCDMPLLRALVKARDNLTEHALAKVFNNMLEALSGIHALELVHRDVKPDNFLCTGEPLVVKLCDFGFASSVSRTIDGRREKKALTGVFGTAPFMAPEMLQEQSYGVEVDVWSFGVTTYVLLLGDFPYHPLERTSLAMKDAIRNDSPVPSFLPAVDTDGAIEVSSESRSFLQAVLRRNPDERPPSKEVLGHGWLNPTGDQPTHCDSCSLQPVLKRAVKAGAFDTRSASDNASVDVDTRLHEEQVKHQPHYKPRSDHRSSNTDEKPRKSSKARCPSDTSTGVGTGTAPGSGSLRTSKDSC